MKKKYKVSLIIILVFIITLGIFYYSRSLNKVAVDNDVIGIYLEDEYESNTYSLSTLGNIPTDGYVLNVEKTNNECSNATFSYDETNNKVNVCTNKSIKCNLYFKVAELPQLVNYEFLYDGSLGDATLNQMSDITGGWTTNDYYMGSQPDVYSIVSASNTNNSIYAYSNTFGKYYMLGTDNPINFNSYSTIYAKISGYDGTKTGSTPYVVPCLSKGVAGSDCVWDLTLRHPSNYGGTSIQSKSLNGFQDSYYVIFVSANSGPRYGNLYELWLVKSDEYNALASKIGVTVSSISELLGYSSQILNNEKAVKFMLKRCTGDFMVAALQNSTFKSAYQSSPYKSMIDANVHWKKFIDMSVV